jgi:ferrochelatase
VQLALDAISDARRPAVPVSVHGRAFRLSMADGCHVSPSCRSRAGLVAAEDIGGRWNLVYQSRSGPPTQPWLEPDVCDAIRGLHAARQVRLR